MNVYTSPEYLNTDIIHAILFWKFLFSMVKNVFVFENIVTLKSLEYNFRLPRFSSSAIVSL